jgi:predicted nucleic acid-binding protein
VILIDTSAWIEFLRPKGNSFIRSLIKDRLLDGSAAYACPIYYELVIGAKKHEMKKLEMSLSISSRITASAQHWNFAATIGESLRVKGLNFPALDLLIASVANSEKIPLLTTDSHFKKIREHVLPDLVLESLIA